MLEILYGVTLVLSCVGYITAGKALYKEGWSTGTFLVALLIIPILYLWATPFFMATYIAAFISLCIIVTQQKLTFG